MVFWVILWVELFGFCLLCAGHVGTATLLAAGPAVVLVAWLPARHLRLAIQPDASGADSRNRDPAAPLQYPARMDVERERLWPS